MKRLTVCFVFFITLSLVVSPPHVDAGTVSVLIVPPPDMGVVPAGDTLTLEFSAEFPSDSTASMAIISVDYDIACFIYNGYTVEMSDVDVSSQFTVADNSGSVVLKCDSIDPWFNTLDIKINFFVENEGHCVFSWRYIYVAYMEPPYFPSTVDVTGETSASVSADTYAITASAGVGGSISPSGAVTVISGDDQAFTITADTGYSILDVLVDELSEGAESSYTFFGVTADHTIAATFKSNPLPPSPGPSIPFFPPPTMPPTPEEIEAMSPEEAAEVIETLDVVEACDILEEINVTAATEILLACKKSTSRKIFEELNKTATAHIVETAIEKNQTDNISKIMLEIEENTTAAILLELKSQSGADIVESMAKTNLTRTAEIVETAVKLRLIEVDEEKAQEILEKMADTLEHVTVESLVDLFIEIANLPATPSTVADIFEVMEPTKTQEIVNMWIHTGALEELATVLDNLKSETLINIYSDISKNNRMILLPYLTVNTISKLPTPARFELSNFSISSVQVVSGETVTTSIDVKNIGDETGNFTATLMINGVHEETQTLTLSSRATTTLSFSFLKAGVGTYNVDINGASVTLTVIAPPSPAEFTLSNLKIQPTEVELGGIVNITVDARNIGEESGIYKLEVKLDGSTVKSENIAMNGGDVKSLIYNIISEEEGDHTIQIDDLRASFKVTAPAEDKTRTSQEFLYLILICAIILVIIASLLKYRTQLFQ